MTLRFERTLEADLAALLKTAFPAGFPVYEFNGITDKPEYPSVTVRYDNGGVSAGFDDTGVFYANMLVICRTYYQDDRNGDNLAGVLDKARSVILPAGLPGRLNAVSEKYTCFGSVIGEDFNESNGLIRSAVLQVQLHFSPVKQQ